ncbi:MAG: hypothetical protein ACPHK8_03480 [Thermoplasmatota archaeon]
MDWEAEVASSRAPVEADVHFADFCDPCGQHISWIDAAWLSVSDVTYCLECAEQAGYQAADGPLMKRPRRTQKVGN